MDFNGFQWISIDFIGFQLISMDFIRFHRISLDFNGFHWISSDFNGFHRISFDFIGFHWISLDFMQKHQCFTAFGEKSCQNHGVLQRLVKRPTIPSSVWRGDPHQLPRIAAKVDEFQGVRTRPAFIKPYSARTPKCKHCLGNNIYTIYTIYTISATVPLRHEVEC